MCKACIQKKEEESVFEELIKLILNAILLKPEIFTQKHYQVCCNGIKIFNNGSLKKIHILGGDGINSKNTKALLSLHRWNPCPLEEKILFVIHDEAIIPTLLEVLAKEKEFFIQNGLNQKVYIFHDFPCCISSDIIGFSCSFLVAKIPGSEKIYPIHEGIARNSIPYLKKYSHKEDISTGGVNFYKGEAHNNVIDINQVNQAELKVFDYDEFAFSADLETIKKYLPKLFKLL